MTTDRTGREEARARLVHLAGLPQAEGGWVPAPPAQPALLAQMALPAQPALPAHLVADDGARTDPDHGGDPDVVDAAPDSDRSEVLGSLALEGRAIRRRALDSAITAYTAAHGHPLDHPAAGGEPVLRRWATRARVVVAAALVLAATTGVVVARAIGQLPSTLVESVDTGDRAGGSTAGTEELAANPTGAGGGTGGADDGTEPTDQEQRTGAEGGAGDEELVIVHVVGQVTEPGLVSLAAGARVADAIEAAGGATGEADLAVLNLARVLTDGEQVLVPRPGEQVATAGGGGAAAASGPGPGGGALDLNGADVAALDALPGIGPVLAQRIVDWRTEHGRFTTVDELGEVTGIGPAVLADLRDLVRV